MRFESHQEESALKVLSGPSNVFCVGFVQPQPITPGGYGRDSHWVGELNSMPAKISFPLGICYPQSGEAMNKAGCPIAAAASQGRLSCAWLPGPGPAAPSRTSRGVSESQSRSTSPTAKDPGAEGQGPGGRASPDHPSALRSAPTPPGCPRRKWQEQRLAQVAGEGVLHNSLRGSWISGILAAPALPHWCLPSRQNTQFLYTQHLHLSQHARQTTHSRKLQT